MNQGLHPHRRGFTLIEMMTVITIIIILAGITVAGMGFITDRQANAKAKVDIDADAQAGILFEAKIDPGSVDSTLKYEVDSSFDYNAGSDSLTVSVDAMDALKEGEEAFDTQFPFITFTTDGISRGFGIRTMWPPRSMLYIQVINA